VLRGDIETICLKALEKDRDRRYQSAVELRQDIERYLDGEPITARRATLTYQLKLLYKRHRAPAVLSIILVVLLVLGVVALSVLATRQASALQEAHRQALRSQSIIDGVTSLLSPVADTEELWERDKTFESVIDHAAVQLDAMFDDIDTEETASNAAYFSLVLAHSYLAIDAADKARTRVDTAMSVLTDWYPDTAPEFSDARTMSIVTSFAQGHEALAMRAGRERVAVKADSLGRHFPDTLGTAYEIADQFRQHGQPDAAAQLIGELVEDMTFEEFRSNQPGLDALEFLCLTRTDTPPPTLLAIVDRLAPVGAADLESGVIVLINNCGWHLGKVGGHPETALQLLDRLQPSLERFEPNEDWPRFNRIYRGEMLRLLGRYDESTQLLKQQIQLDRDDPAISAKRRNYAIEKLAETYDASGQTDEAAALRKTMAPVQ
jgi:tetratricopeptide (TPR) repeat protein